jgi:hypothetical protein
MIPLPAILLLKTRNAAGAVLRAVQRFFAWLASNPLALGAVAALGALALHSVRVSQVEKRVAAETRAAVRAEVEVEMAERLVEIKEASKVEVVKADTIRGQLRNYVAPEPAPKPLPDYHYRD